VTVSFLLLGRPSDSLTGYMLKGYGVRGIRSEGDTERGDME